MSKKQFHVFGELVEIIVSSEETHGSFCVIHQTSPPGGGPPPHRHTKEDECFLVLEGDYEIFDGATWHLLNAGETAFTLRGSFHTFRNRGTTVGKIQATIVPGGLDEYLEKLSQLSMPPVIEDVMAISGPYGLSFAPPPTPVA